MRFLESLCDAILDRSPEELTAAMLIAAAVAFVMSGLYALGRKKSSPSPTFVGGLAFAASALCMLLAAGYLKYDETDWRSGSAANASALPKWPVGGPGRGGLRPAWSFSGAGWSSGFHVVVAADENRDGLLTSEEVARLVRKADVDGDGSVNSIDIDRLISSRFRSPFRPTGSDSLGPNDTEGGDGPPDNVRRAEASRSEHTKNLDVSPALESGDPE